MIRRFLFISIYIFSAILAVHAQDEPTVVIPADMGGLYSQGGAKVTDANFQSPITSRSLEEPVNPDKYVLGPGDEIGISLRGATEAYFRVRVTPEAKIAIPLAPAVDVDGITVSEAAKLVTQEWTESFPNSVIELALLEIRVFRVSISGAVQNPGIFEVTAADRAGTLINLAGGFVDDTYWRMYYATELSKPFVDYERLKDNLDLKVASKRRAKLIHRDGSSETVDLLSILLTGDNSTNPYLKDGDKLVVNYRSDFARYTKVSGAVNNPSDYEWIEGDNLRTLINLAGGVITDLAADSVLISGNQEDGSELKIIALKDVIKDNNQEVLINPDDLIYVRPSVKQNKPVYIKVEGEIFYPGSYPVIPGKTRVSDIIRMAGGFTENAFLKGSRVWRKKDVNDYRIIESKRAEEIPSVDRATIEAQYYQFAYRWQGYDRVAINFEELFEGNDDSFDYYLEEGDVITVPEMQYSVLVMGQVSNPGRYPYVEGWNFKDYIKAAGGFAKGSRPSYTKWVSYESHVWQKPDRGSEIGPGDMIFVPEVPERYAWNIFKEMLGITAQVITVIVVTLNLIEK